MLEKAEFPSRVDKGFTRRSSGGFTIIELLTVMSIIIILMGVLVPALSKVRRYAKVVTQKGQFHEISKAIELFRNDHSDTYPDSGASDNDPAGPYGYCGAMKMCEALLGQDGMGFHPASRFYASGIGTSPTTGLDTDLYPLDLCTSTDPGAYSGASPTNPTLAANIQERTKYIDVENIKATRLQDLYINWSVTGGVSFYNSVAFQATTDTYPFAFPNAVICDVFQRTISRCNGAKLGMPVLYYKADPSKMVHDVNTVPAISTPNPNIYNFDDNYAITALGCPWESVQTTAHPMFTDKRIFLKEITNTRITTTPRPHNEDGYILLSAGYDNLYGTKDDVFNFTD